MTDAPPVRTPNRIPPASHPSEVPGQLGALVAPPPSHPHPAAETAIQPQIRCFKADFPNLSSYPEECFFHRHRYVVLSVSSDLVWQNTDQVLSPDLYEEFTRLARD